MKLRTLFSSVFTGVMLAASPTILTAQSPFSPVISINNSAVTHFEVEQRALFLTVLGTIGDVEKRALIDLIDDRLKLQAGRALGLTLSQDEATQGMIEFAERASLTPEQLIAELAKEGIYPETFADFVGSGIMWRKVVQFKFQAKAFITEAELDTAMALGTTALSASVLLSEIIVPFTAETEADTLELVLDVRSEIRSFDDFDIAALTYSAAASRADAGKLDWRPITALPLDMRTQMMTMGVGQVTFPIKLSGAYLLYQLRGIRDNRTVVAKTIAYDYAILQLPGGRSDATLKTAADLASKVDSCSDLFAESQKFPEENFTQQVLPVRSVPRHIALELANLDANEISTTLTQGTNGEFLTFLMLCGRTNKLSEGDREEVRNALFVQRMEAFGEGYLQELLGDAIILNP
ncbi:MAG: peptidyl-prolyl cis-trans isomerase SurA [Paracoccaceae bacterium]|jgi:peptidyl-prolyl cis-trans isomerase SurA